MADESESLFRYSVANFAEGVQVQHIATFGLQTCDLNDDAAAVRARHPDFDHVPVCRDGNIVGVVELIGRLPPGPVGALCRLLD